jgi:hypothetical protein
MHKLSLFAAAAALTASVSLPAQAGPLTGPALETSPLAIQVAEPGYASRGGDGGGLPGLPGGKGGRSGAAARYDDDDDDNRPYRRGWFGRYYNSLSAYCQALNHRRWWQWWRPPVFSDRYDPDDCGGRGPHRNYGYGRHGSSGPSIAGGVGGRGGSAGYGAGGGSGGSGGAGVAGGVGGRGGAGGSAY